MPRRVAVAFETLEYVVSVAIACLRCGRRRFVRAPAAAAQEHHGRILRHRLRELRQELRIWQHAGIAFPLDLDAAGNAPDEIEFGAAAHVDEFCAGLLLEHRLRFGRQQRAFVGQPFFTRPGACGLHNFIDSGHVGTPKPFCLKAKFYSEAGAEQSALIKCKKIVFARYWCKCSSHATKIGLWHNVFPGLRLGIFRAELGFPESSVFDKHA